MAWWRRAIVASELLSLRSGEEPVEDDGDAAGCGNRGRGPLGRGFMQAIGEEALSGEDGHPRGPLNVLSPGCGCQAGWASGQAGGDGLAEGVAAGGGGPQAHRRLALAQEHGEAGFGGQALPECVRGSPGRPVG